MGKESKMAPLKEHDESKIKVGAEVTKHPVNNPIQILHTWIERLCDPQDNLCAGLNKTLAKVSLAISSN